MRTRYPRATAAIAAVTALSYALIAVGGAAGAAVDAGGFVPARFSGLAAAGLVPLWATPLTAALLHAGLLHIAFNLLTLVYCGKEDEVALGPWGVAIVYAIGAYAAAAAQYLADPLSTTPMIGASGAVSALVGAYAILYGRRGASRLHPELARLVHIAWLAAAWIGLQLLVGIASQASGVAVATAAHVGGFIAGLLLARPLLAWRYRKA